MSDDSVLPDRGGSQAVLVGVDAYQKLEALPPVAENLTRLASLFQDPSRWGLAASNCVQIRNPTSSAAVYDALEEAAAEVTDTLVFYYAGHGLIDADATDDELYLALPDSRPDSAYRTGMPYGWIRREILKARKARRKVVILDCCYSGRALARMGPQTGDDAIRRLLDIDGTCVLTASARTRTALAPPDEALTAFTGVLVEALTIGIPDGPELIDVETLYRYAWQRLLAKERPRPQKAETGLGGRIALSRNPAHRAFLVHEVARLTTERDEAFARIAHLEAKFDDGQSELVEQLRAEVTANQEKLGAARRELAGARHEAGELTLAVSDLEWSAGQHADERDRVIARTRQLEADLAVARADSADAERLRSKAAALTKSLETAQEAVNLARSEAQANAEDSRRLQREADVRIGALTRSLRAAETTLQASEQAKAAAKQAQQLAEVERTAARSALQQVTGERDRARADKDRTDALIERLREEILHWKRQVPRAKTSARPKRGAGMRSGPTAAAAVGDVSGRSVMSRLFGGLVAFLARKGRRAVALILLLIFLLSNVMYVLIAWKGLFNQ